MIAELFKWLDTQDNSVKIISIICITIICLAIIAALIAPWP